MWRGPLYDNGHAVSPRIFPQYTKKYMEQLFDEMNIDIGPRFTRDFFQGVAHAVGSTINSITTILRFIPKQGLLDFITSENYGFKIKMGHAHARYVKTLGIPFFAIPYRGNRDAYLAGVLAASDLVYKRGEFFLRVSSKCEDELKKFGVLYKQDKRMILISPFYYFLYSGDIPDEVNVEIMPKLIEASPRKMKTAAADAIFHWRIINGTLPFKAGMLPCLWSKSNYYNYLSSEVIKIKEKMNDKRFDFVDVRIRQRCERWYNIHTEESLI